MKEEDVVVLLQTIKETLEQMNDKLETIIKEKKVESEIHLHIENVSIETLQLDELAYHLDKIDIKELSGMLNLGNSFSPKVQPQQKAAKKQNSPSQESSEKTNSATEEDDDTAYQKQNRTKPSIEIVINGKKITGVF